MFDPRYRDFPFAGLTMAVVPFAAPAAQPPANRACGRSRKRASPALLAVAALYIGVNEGRDNWQSLWTCAVYLAARGHAVAGAGRAKPKISRPIASPDSAML